MGSDSTSVKIVIEEHPSRLALSVGFQVLQSGTVRGRFGVGCRPRACALAAVRAQGASALEE